MRDNKTSQPAHEYDDNIVRTMPFYDHFHDITISFLEIMQPRPSAWLDTGCGTGTLVIKAAGNFPGTRFTLADPSAAMLAIAKEKTATLSCEYLEMGTEELPCSERAFDVITAVLAHHYFDAEARRRATANCYRMLKEGGVYISFETFLPATDYGKRAGLQWWRRAQLALGKDEVKVEKYIKRFGVEFFPISLSAHLALLQASGFAKAEVLWVSGMQAGFYAVK